MEEEFEDELEELFELELDEEFELELDELFDDEFELEFELEPLSSHHQLRWRSSLSATCMRPASLRSIETGAAPGIVAWAGAATDTIVATASVEMVIVLAMVKVLSVLAGGCASQGEGRVRLPAIPRFFCRSRRE